MLDDPRLPSIAYVSLDQAQRYAEATVKGSFGLASAEKFWTDRYSHLRSHGYVLRARYTPDWCPSWLGTNLDPTFCEDSTMLKRHKVIDAIRQHDGSLVAIKETRNDTEEIGIASFLSSSTLMADPRNHLPPLLEVFRGTLDPQTSFMVMPYLRPFNDPEFGAVGEVVDFVRQSLQGLWFLHEQRVAHRDCAAMNIMMDARALYPSDHHPVRRGYSLNGANPVTPLARIDHPVRYYLIDFGMSTRFPPGTSSHVLGTACRDKEVPELSLDVPYAIRRFQGGHLRDGQPVRQRVCREPLRAGVPTGPDRPDEATPARAASVCGRSRPAL
ncbi:hypothetical protein IEO21_06454 [Rhodonia placenta]|uniref:Protein kinase domain-containing protein n=1 Tax=Rhodonia placenta TaxID=104341 RepID=A0A8H7U1A0_9APHY|nr:hypothetical protein IEO21_06454 [Postia placenta]